MPVEFLSDEQAAQYGRYAGDPAPEQLSNFFFLNEAELALIAERRRDHNQLGFAVQLCTLRFLGSFLPNPVQVPSIVVRHVADQLHLPARVIARYALREETRYQHRRIIVAALDYRDFDGGQAVRLIRWLYAQLALSALRPSVLFDLATAQLIRRKVVLPGVTVLARLVARVRERFHARTFEQLSQKLSPSQRQALENLLILPSNARFTPLEVLRTSPARISSPALKAALHRIEQIRALGVSAIDLSEVPQSRQALLARHAQTAWAQTLLRMTPSRRQATLLIFLQALERSATDDALDLFDQFMTHLTLTGEVRRKRERLRTLKDLDQAALRLRDAVRVLLDETVSDGDLRELAFRAVSAGELRQAVETISALASEDADTSPEALSNAYGTVRRFLPAFLHTVELDGTASAQPLLDAWNFLRKLETGGRDRPQWRDAPRGFVSRAWQRRVFPHGGKTDHQAYTLCLLERLQQALRRREVFAPGSDRYGDPRAELLQGASWDAVSDDVCRALNRSLDPQPELERLRLELDGAYREVELNLPQNTALQLDGQPGQTRLRLTPLEPVPEPPGLERLQHAVAQRLPAVPLAALLLEVHAFTGLADAFTHVTDGTSRLRDLPLSVTAVLLAQACNIGLGAVAAPDVQALTLSRLSWVQQNYVRAETIVAANARLVDAQFSLPLAHTWGGGEVASADGLRFVVPVKTLHAGWNRKYFGSQRGVTYYNFTSDQFTGFHGIVIPGTLRDSLFILAGLLEQQTRLDPREIMADTHGSSDVVFGLFALLGYRFSPRLADLPDQRFWRLDREADYGALDDLSRHVVDERLIAAHWEDMLRLAGSLKLGKVKATAVMRTLQRGGSLSGLGRAIAEFGRIEKTLFLLNYVGDEAYRRRILRQINRGEQRHGVGRAVFHGRKGELRQKYREGMEDQLGALGLVVNAIVLWNTRYMGVALDDLRQAGKIEDERDISRLTPLLHGHIRMLGTYEFKLPEEIAQGQLRPLRDPDTVQAYLEGIEL
ncbi:MULTISPECIES: Tn3 family transposase [unclassified Deinococcus]|uniref:Tn3 family transposase n=1 Tax=unclassified Deinococcus TaxID=2623546 RepID=UPI0006DC043B|nr:MULTISPECIES: Tn3 family transposase [unclassified Deinococcus]MCD0168206.1 Tn3 family transposase [Deinococcus sp. 23YEL01]PIG98236.1 DDE transposase [Deinococcus sp. UR1]